MRTKEDTINILKNVDNMLGYNDKLEYLNKCYLDAKSDTMEVIILDLIKQLKFYGK